MIYGLTLRVPIVRLALSVAICRMDEATAAALAVEEENAREVARERARRRRLECDGDDGLGETFVPGA